LISKKGVTGEDALVLCKNLKRYKIRWIKKFPVDLTKGSSNFAKNFSGFLIPKTRYLISELVQCCPNSPHLVEFKIFTTRLSTWHCASMCRGTQFGKHCAYACHIWKFKSHVYIVFLINWVSIFRKYLIT